MTRNLVDAETAERNRTEGHGGYTFNAPVASDYEGVVFTVACVRLGDHAHVDVESGRAVPRLGDILHPNARQPHYRRGRAGRLVLRWHEWEVLRELLALSGCVHIAEVERPTDSQIAFHAGYPDQKEEE